MEKEQPPIEIPQVDQSRRRFARAGLSSGVILTLASQPVLGTTSVHCTPSGNTSLGVQSRNPNTTPCNLCGKGKDYWEPHTECKTKTFYEHMGSDCSDYKDSSAGNKCSWILKPSYENFCLRKEEQTSKYGGGYWSGFYTTLSSKSSYYPNTGYTAGYNAGKQAVTNLGPNAYKSVDIKGKKDGLYDNYKSKCSSWGHSTSQQEYQRGYRDGFEAKCREQYGSESSHCQTGNEMWDFARECLVSVLNCKIQCSNDYGVTEQVVKKMWSSCKNGNTYEVRSGVYWSRSDCMTYLKKLHT